MAVGQIISRAIADGAITTSDINDGDITHAKLHTDMDLSAKTLTVPATVRGPATLTIDPAAVGDNTGLVVIAGSLQVDGTTTTINSTTMTVDDKNIVLASGAANSAAADGAGITIDGASATILYTHATTSIDFNKNISATLATASQPNITSVGTLTSLNTSGDIYLGGDKGIFFEGSTDDAYEVYLRAIDATADRSIRLPDASGTLLIQDSSNDVTIQADTTSSGVDPQITLYKNDTGNGSDGDGLAAIRFKGKNSSGGDHTFGWMESSITTATAGSEEGSFRISVAGSNTTYQNEAYAGGTGLTIFNDRTEFKNRIKLVTTTNSSNSLSFDDPVLTLYRADPNVSTFDYLGAIHFTGMNSADEETVYTRIVNRPSGITDGSEEGILQFWQMLGGTETLTYDFRPHSFRLRNEQDIQWVDHKGTNYECTLDWETPSANRTVTFPNQTGTVVLADSSGNVGIGTTSPAQPLDIAYTNNTAYSVNDFTDSNQSGLMIENTSTTANAFSNLVFRVGSGADLFFGIEQKSANDGDFIFANQNSPNIEMMRITSGGNVGIGVTDPDAVLDISGSTNKLGILRVVQRLSGATAYGLDVGLDPSTGDPVFSRIVNDAVSESFRIQRSSGNVMIGTSVQGRAAEGADRFTIADATHSGMTIRSGTSSYGSINFSDSEGGTGEYAGSIFFAHGGLGDKLVLATAGVDRITIDSNNRIGIGTQTPKKLLHLYGDENSGGLGLVIQDDGWGAPNGMFMTTVRNSDGAYTIRKNTSNAFDFATYTDMLSVRGDGKVGIGTTTPTQILEVSAGAPTIGLNSPGQATNQKIVRIASSQYTGGDFSVQQMNDNGTSIRGTPFLINNAGNIGIGTTSPDSLLHLQKTRTGSITGGSSDTGAVLKLHTEAQWESGYGNNSTTSSNDFLGSVEFSSGDNSSGEGVRAAIRATVDSYYNTNSLRFYTAPSNTVGVVNRLNIHHNGNIGIGGNSAALSPESQIVIARNHSTYNNGDQNKRIEFQANGSSHRTETLKTFHYSYNPIYNRYSWHIIKLGDAASAGGHSIRYRVIWTTGHASGHGYEEGVCSVGSQHSAQNLNKGATSGQGEAHVRYAYQYTGGSYYGWSSTPNVRFYYSSATGSNAQIYMRVEGHGNHNGGTWDMACTHTIFVELHGADNVTNRTVRFTGHSTPSDTNSAISFITLNT